MMNLRLALFGGSALLLALSGMSIVACSDNTNPTFPSAKQDAGDDSDDTNGDDDEDASTGTHDASTSTDAGKTDSSSSSGNNIDIYGCGSDNDCTSGQHCVITAYDGWDASSPDFATGTECDLKAAAGSECKDTADIVASDLYTCTQARADAGGAFTSCPTSGTACQVIEVYDKEFGACLPTNATTGCSSLSTPPYVPYTDAPNYCFHANTTGGCTMPNIVCCDKEVNKVYTATCVAQASDCN